MVSSASRVVLRPSMMKLYGVPLSQPFRSVAWTLLQLELPFQVQMAVPGMASKIGTKHENFRSLTPHRSAHVPLLVYNDDVPGGAEVALTESPAIMAHLCERFADDGSPSASLYPASGTVSKAKVDSYLHWHHSNTRPALAGLFQTKVRPDLKTTLTEEDHKQLQELLQALDSGWLNYDGQADATNAAAAASNAAGSASFIGGLDHPTIADILAYGELANVTMTNMLQVSSEEYPLLHAWMIEMSRLPHHDQVHQALTTLGDLSTDGDDDAKSSLGKRLGAATKAGLQGIADAQASYTGDEAASKM